MEVISSIVHGTQDVVDETSYASRSAKNWQWSTKNDWNETIDHSFIRVVDFDFV
jgi:hypothetical protein